MVIHNNVLDDKDGRKSLKKRSRTFPTIFNAQDIILTIHLIQLYRKPSSQRDTLGKFPAPAITFEGLHKYLDRREEVIFPKEVAIEYKDHKHTSCTRYPYIIFMPVPSLPIDSHTKHRENRKIFK